MKCYTTIKKKKNALLIDFHSLGGSQGHYVGVGEQVAKGHMEYDSIDMAFLQWQSSRDGKQNSVCQGLGMVVRVGHVRWAPYKGAA